MTISGVFGKKLSLVLAPLILAACAADMTSAVEIPRDENGAAFLTYQEARGPLANFVDAGAPDGFARVSPTAPPSGFSQGEQSSYWMSMTAGGLEDCGFRDTARELEQRSAERSAFVAGQLKIKGKPLVSCQAAKRFAEAILAAFEPR
jgi:hypothetical protein